MKTAKATLILFVLLAMILLAGCAQEYEGRVRVGKDVRWVPTGTGWWRPELPGEYPPGM